MARDNRELAALKGVPIAEAVGDPVRSELHRMKRDMTVEERLRAVEEIVKRLEYLPIVGPMLTDDDLYDEQGLQK